MGKLKRQPEIKAIDEESEVDDTHDSFSKSAIAYTVSSEAGVILSVMRRYTGWGGVCISGDEQLENSLIHSLKSLRKQIFSWNHHWRKVNPVLYLRPFLDVIRSEDTGAHITYIALSSVYNIITLDLLDLATVNVDTCMHMLVDAVTNCRFEGAEPAMEESVLVKMLHVLLACMKSKVYTLLSNQHVCTIVNTCFRVYHQAWNKSELLQRVARHSMRELVRSVFSHLPDACLCDHSSGASNPEMNGPEENGIKGSEEEKTVLENNGLPPRPTQTRPSENTEGTGETQSGYDLYVMAEPFGVPCMVEIFHFLCSLLNVGEQPPQSPQPGFGETLPFDEPTPLFPLDLVNSAIELGGSSFARHPPLLRLVQDDLFRNLIHFGLSPSSPILFSMLCSVVLNLYHHLRRHLKLQLESFFSSVLLRLAQVPSQPQLQEVAMEAIVDLCSQKGFMVEMYANFDSDITCKDIFEDFSHLLSRVAFPVNSPLSSIHLLALDGLISVIGEMAERIDDSEPRSECVEKTTIFSMDEYVPFWTVKCESYTEPRHWVEFVRKKKCIKARLVVGADHFNRDPKKGLEFLQGTHLLPEKLDPCCVACFFRYTSGLDKNLVGDFLGNHDDFCIQVLHEFSATFDFKNMSLDTALRLFLETFRLPGESQKIQRVLEAFSEKYYDQSRHILANKDAALLLSYSLIMLNTDQHNIQVKKKMTEEDFIRNNRHINNGNDLPREFLSELYYSICRNEIRTTPEELILPSEMTPAHWIDLLRRSHNTSPYILPDPWHPYLDHEMFAVMSGPAMAALSMVFENADSQEVHQTCVDGFLAVAKISAFHCLDDVVDDLAVSLSKFTALLGHPMTEEPADDTKARAATLALFTIASRFGDCLRTGWRNILDCIIRLHKLSLLSARVAVDDLDDDELSAAAQPEIRPFLSSLSSTHLSGPLATPGRSSGLMGRFSQLLSLDTDDFFSQPTGHRLAAEEMVRKCRIECIFTESKHLRPESLIHFAHALTWASGRRGNTIPDDEDTSVFCLELLIAVMLNNRNRVGLLWPAVYEHLAGILHSAVLPSPLVEKAVFGLLHIFQRLLPCIPDTDIPPDDLFRSLHLLLKLDGRVADAYCEQTIRELDKLVRKNTAYINSSTVAWQTVMLLIQTTVHHPGGSAVGFELLGFLAETCGRREVLVEGARGFAEAREGGVERSVRAVEMMGRTGTEDEEGWLRAVEGLRRVSTDKREEVRNAAIVAIGKCVESAAGIGVTETGWGRCMEEVFVVWDELVEREWRNIEESLGLGMGVMCEIWVRIVVEKGAQMKGFCKVWLGVLGRMERGMKVRVRGRRCERLEGLVNVLLEKCLVEMKRCGVLMHRNAFGGDALWELTWLHTNNISPSLTAKVFPSSPPSSPAAFVVTRHDS